MELRPFTAEFGKNRGDTENVFRVEKRKSDRLRRAGWVGHGAIEPGEEPNESGAVTDMAPAHAVKFGVALDRFQLRDRTRLFLDFASR
jgi:hypothetical protein